MTFFFVSSLPFSVATLRLFGNGVTETPWVMFSVLLIDGVNGVGSVLSSISSSSLESRLFDSFFVARLEEALGTGVLGAEVALGAGGRDDASSGISTPEEDCPRTGRVSPFTVDFGVGGSSGACGNFSGEMETA